MPSSFSIGFLSGAWTSRSLYSPRPLYDVLYIPLGASGYSIKRFFFAVLAGKAVLASIMALSSEAEGLSKRSPAPRNWA
ncbi:MAG: hypothetical protein TU35_000610 [Thermoproteus sp. AZ2]|uniref:Uncharacterized protein n=1 Tax=Thermoproteus sp. AZ2 TaxID=1609232 RepID=A0ACC6UZF9_9CREN